MDLFFTMARNHFSRLDNKIDIPDSLIMEAMNGPQLKTFWQQSIQKFFLDISLYAQMVKALAMVIPILRWMAIR